MKVGKYEYHRCCQQMPCPVCGRTHWCLISEDLNWAICTKMSEGARYEMKSWYGWKHCLNGVYQRPKKLIKTVEHIPNLEYIREVYNTLHENHYIGAYTLENTLNVSVLSLNKLCMKVKDKLYYFPMYDSLGNMIGLKKRNLEGKKWCQPKSRLGIYWPKGFIRTKPTIVCEGESDTAAMLGYYPNVLGRASAHTGSQYLKELLVRCPKVCIVADNDTVGLREANRLQGVLGPKSYVVVPGKYKDTREWINSGTFKLKELQL